MIVTEWYSFRDFKNNVLKLDKFRERHEPFISKMKESDMYKVNAFVNEVISDKKKERKELILIPKYVNSSSKILGKSRCASFQTQKNRSAPLILHCFLLFD
jgi:hypothetical protein